MKFCRNMCFSNEKIDHVKEAVLNVRLLFDTKRRIEKLLFAVMTDNYSSIVSLQNDNITKKFAGNFTVSVKFRTRIVIQIFSKMTILDSHIRRSTFYVHTVHKDLYYPLKLFSTLLTTKRLRLLFTLKIVRDIAKSPIPWYIRVSYLYIARVKYKSIL